MNVAVDFELSSACIDVQCQNCCCIDSNNFVSNYSLFLQLLTPEPVTALSVEVFVVNYILKSLCFQL